MEQQSNAGPYASGVAILEGQKSRGSTASSASLKQPGRKTVGIYKNFVVHCHNRARFKHSIGFTIAQVPSKAVLSGRDARKSLGEFSNRIQVVKIGNRVFVGHGCTPKIKNNLRCIVAGKGAQKLDQKLGKRGDYIKSIVLFRSICGRSNAASDLSVG